jgi:hypothetical protein
MASIYEQEWLRLQYSVEHHPVFGVENRDDSAHATRAKEKKVYHDDDISHMYVWCREAHANILTVHPEMGLSHRHLTVEPCVKGTKKDTRHIYTFHFPLSVLGIKWIAMSISLLGTQRSQWL